MPTARRQQVRMLAEIAVFFAVVFADSIGLVPLTQTIVLLPLIWLSLRLGKEPWASIGLSRPPFLLRTVVLGVILGLAMELLAVYVTTPAISAYFGGQPDYSDFKAIEGSIPVLLIFLALSWTLAAFGEEICFRGFLMERLARLFGGGCVAWVLSLVLAGVLFGWGHTEQGVSGWVQEGLSGLLLGVLFLVARKNLVLPIITHGMSNTLAFILIYLGKYPGVG
ncbi:MAG TPA: type II CAAX endopeptidase family protein [Woeseiaceae bacterium]|nr:type II CAAX endopeptidase family protein [Woeseiaceae bacterium]